MLFLLIITPHAAIIQSPRIEYFRAWLYRNGNGHRRQPAPLWTIYNIQYASAWPGDSLMIHGHYNWLMACAGYDYYLASMHFSLLICIIATVAPSMCYCRAYYNRRWYCITGVSASLFCRLRHAWYNSNFMLPKCTANAALLKFY